MIHVSPTDDSADCLNKPLLSAYNYKEMQQNFIISASTLRSVANMCLIREGCHRATNHDD